MIYDLSGYSQDCYSVPDAAELMGLKRGAVRKMIFKFDTLAAMWERRAWIVPAAEIERRKQGHHLTPERRRQIMGAALDADGQILPQNLRLSGPALEVAA